MTSPPDLTTYPRPDFSRRGLRWESLNGPWDFLFDDEDVGLDAKWHLHGLPASVTLSTSASHDDGTPECDEVGDRVTQSIVSGTQERLSENTLNKTSGTSENAKTTIKVPFVFQSPASGINERGVHEVLWYEREIKDLRNTYDRDRRDSVLLRFGAVDYQATVWVNGRFCRQHRGGHVPFDVDITDALNCTPAQASHRVTLRVYDSAYDLTQPRGKQYWGAKPESIFYTPSGGIWQNVWTEVVPRARIADSSQGTVLRSNDIIEGILHATIGVLGRKAGEKLDVELKAWHKGQLVSMSARKTLPKETSLVEIDLDMKFPGSSVEKYQEPSGEVSGKLNSSMLVWSPENPLLYGLSIRLYNANGDLVDLAETHVGMRSIEWSDGTWKLNGKPYFQALVLDQGYWPETFMTPPSADALRQDIEHAKRMGFNGCRKHQKVEDPVFYHWADKLGFLVWGEMASAYKFSSEYAERFNEEWTEAVKLVINHPSVVTWTPVNESWGYPALHDNVQQRNHVRALYYLTKSLDPTRPINDNCGWQHVETDLTTFHDYSDGPELAKTCADLRLILGKKADRDVFVPEMPGRDPGAKHTDGKPIMCTEFGGVNIAAAKPGERDRDWGYTTAQNPDDLLKRIERLVRGVVEGGHCCAFVYTQLTDIQQEANGLYTFDRREKLDANQVKAVIHGALKVFYDRVAKNS
ncbi:beta-galactosidase [Akanthomyces lecanii RCEF 1005]|uniref:Beta-galactosidase n=1 Tax=Akanthomyces lecanii RCEF 1005 TaxID=1081108 RepID=A0A162N2B2_CORDF|nr:beta-galactosidase [Akanthomyces lecanii RCEF 1005]